MTEFFRFLVETNLVTAAFVIGAIAFVIAIIGKFKTIIEPSPTMRLLLAAFGLILMAFSLGSYFISPQTKPDTTGTPSEPMISPLNQPISNPTPTYEAFCGFVTRTQIEDLKDVQGVSTAIKQAEQFSGFQQNDFGQGHIIPAGVLIAMDLLTTDIQQFEVIPINRQGGWGLFLTTTEFEAPNTGTYWCVQEQ